MGQGDPDRAHQYLETFPAKLIPLPRVFDGLAKFVDFQANLPPAWLKVGSRVDAAAMRHGLILRLIGDRVVFAPPLVIEEDEIGEIGERLRRALDEVASDLTREAALG